MTNVFISYRRSDSSGYAGRLSDSLEARVGADRIFRDIEDIKPGEDFVQSIEQNLKNASLFLVVIGRDWLDAKDDQGLRRLDNPQDYVRLEIETALRVGGVVIPVLVGGAKMPLAKSLPDSIAGLANLQAMEITDSRWEQDIERLLRTLSELAIDKRQDQSRNGGWFRRFIILLGVPAAAALLFFIIKFYFLVPDLSGNWYFESANNERSDYLLIKQDGDHFAVERTDPAMQTTYEKGAGVVKGRHLKFDLEPVYSQQYRYRGNFELSWDGERLAGDLQEVLSNETTPLTLNRIKPESKAAKK